MGIAILKLKVMPSSPSVDLEKIKKEAEKIFLKNNAQLHGVDKEPIAFGLVALIFTVSWSEENSQDILETELSKVKDVNSVQVIDFRRAFG